MTVVLVACVGKKLEAPAPAADLYQSVWFKKARRYAEAVGDRWFILSAKHGLIYPESVIEPYDLTLKTMGSGCRQVWAEGVLWSLESVACDETIMILAGAYYREPLVDWLRVQGYRVKVPMLGLGIGQQLKWLNEQLAKQPAGQVRVINNVRGFYYE